ncbi:MAG: hypothetical protein Q8S31_03250 [Alphaproteobacteria bacterium]|nr:hypothetical protein [Alphaproteobacteria bacterium]
MRLRLTKIMLLTFLGFFSIINSSLYAGPSEDKAMQLCYEAGEDADKLYQLGVQFRNQKIKELHPVLKALRPEGFNKFAIDCFIKSHNLKQTAKTFYNIGHMAYILLGSALKNGHTDTAKDLLDAAIDNFVCSIWNPAVEEGLDAGIRTLKNIFTEFETEKYASLYPMREKRLLHFFKKLFLYSSLLNDENTKQFFQYIEQEINEYYLGLQARIAFFWTIDCKNDKKNALNIFVKRLLQDAEIIDEQKVNNQETPLTKEQEEAISLSKSTIERFRLSPDKLYKLGLSFRNGEWENLPELDQLKNALECFKTYHAMNTKNSKASHNVGNINFRLYEYHCNRQTEIENRLSYLEGAFVYYFLAWNQGEALSKKNIKIMLNRLDKEPHLKSTMPSLYMFFVSFLSSLQEKKFRKMMLKNFANAYIGRNTPSTQIVKKMIDYCKNNFDALNNRQLDLWVADYVQTLNLTPEDLEEFLIPDSLLQENYDIALQIQQQTTDQNLIVFVGRSLPWVMEMYKNCFPNRNILNVPFSLLNRGYDLDIKTVDDLKLLKMDTEIEYYKSYLDSLGFGVEGDLYKNYNRIVLVDFIASGSTLSIFRAIMEDLNPNLKDGIKVILCSRYDTSSHKLFKFSGIPFEIILLSPEFCNHRSFKYGPSSILVPGFVFTPDLWSQWQEITNYDMPISPIVKMRQKQIKEWVER